MRLVNIRQIYSSQRTWSKARSESRNYSSFHLNNEFLIKVKLPRLKGRKYQMNVKVKVTWNREKTSGGMLTWPTDLYYHKHNTGPHWNIHRLNIHVHIYREYTLTSPITLKVSPVFALLKRCLYMKYKTIIWNIQRYCAIWIVQREFSIEWLKYLHSLGIFLYLWNIYSTALLGIKTKRKILF